MEKKEKKIVVLDHAVEMIFYDRWIVGAKVVRGGYLTAEAAQQQAEDVNGATHVKAIRGVRSLKNKDLHPPRGWRKWRPLEVAALCGLPAKVEVVEKTGTKFRQMSILGSEEIWTEWEEEVKSSRPFGEDDVGAYMAIRLDEPAAEGWRWDLERGFVSEVR